MVWKTVDRAIDFLISRCNQDGWWQDFDTLAGQSDEWVTAYIGFVLAQIDTPKARETAYRSWDLLEKRKRPVGWGYNQWVPSDADTTVWVMYLAYYLGKQESKKIKRAESFLARHLQVSGALATYADDKRIRLFTNLLPDISFRGWCSSHPCVTALAANLPGIPYQEQMLGYLRTNQHIDGSWVGYWWCDDEYTTALAVDALAKREDVRSQTCIDLAAAWAYRHVSASGRIMTNEGYESAFAEAWCLHILTKTQQLHYKPLLEMLIKRLIETQQADGSWISSARLRIPFPGLADPENYRYWTFNTRGGGSIQVDQNACFTTATVLNALHKAKAFGD